MKKYKLDLDSAEGITKIVLKKHRKWAKARVKECEISIQNLPEHLAADMVYDMKLVDALNTVLNYFGEK